MTWPTPKLGSACARPWASQARRRPSTSLSLGELHRPQLTASTRTHPTTCCSSRTACAAAIPGRPGISLRDRSPHLRRDGRGVRPTAHPFRRRLAFGPLAPRPGDRRVLRLASTSGRRSPSASLTLRPRAAGPGVVASGPTLPRHEGRAPDQLVQLAGRRRRHRADARAHRAHGRRRGLRLDLGHGPLLPDRLGRAARGAHARRPHRARLDGRPLEPGAPGPHGRGHPLPPGGALAQGHDDARRALGRAGLVRHRGGLERGGVARPGLPHAPAARALRDARGHASLRARGLGRRARQRGAFRGPAPARYPRAQQPAGALPAASAHPRRRRGRAAHAAPGGPLCGCLQRLRHRPGAPDPQVRGAAAPLRDGGPPLRGHREDHPHLGRGVRGRVAGDAHARRARRPPGRRGGGRGAARDHERAQRVGRVAPRAHRPRRHPAAARRRRPLAGRRDAARYSRGVSGPSATMPS